MIRFLRWLLGYVKFSAIGGFSERFLNLCKINNIGLWSVSNNGTEVSAIASRKDFNKLFVPAENSGMSIENIHEKGLPLFLEKHRSRVGVVVGVCATALFVFFMSGSIWSIEIIEKDGVKLESFTDELRNEGVKIGARKSNIDILQVQENLLNKYPELSWVSVNIFGSKAQIEYTPIKKNQPLDDAKTPTNIIASKEGKITLVEGYRGVSEVREGDSVAEGSLLISGIVTNENLTESFVHAQGKVFALTDNQMNFKVKTSNTLPLSKEAINEYNLNLFGFNLPLGFKKTEKYSTESKILLNGNGVVLPFGVIRNDSIVFWGQEVKLTDSQADLLLLKTCIEHKRSEYEDAEFKKISYKFYEKGNEKRVQFNIKCVENIAMESYVFVEEN